jgi:hypothetical protein
MSDSSKTKKQLIEELQALRKKVEGETANEASSGGKAERGITRREVISGWVAPVILTVPLASRMAEAQPVPEGTTTIAPTPPTPAPTPPTPVTTAPTPEPTPPTPAPTLQAPPTPEPSPPTPVPTTQAPPTPVPTTVIPVELTEFDVD